MDDLLAKETQKLTTLEKEYQALTGENSTLRNLNFISAGNVSKGAKTRRENLINKQLKLIEEIRLQKLIIKIISKVDFDFKDLTTIIRNHALKAEHIRIREVAMYDGYDVSRLPIGNAYEIVFLAEKKLQPKLRKFGLTFNGMHVLRDKEGRFKKQQVA